MFGMGHWEILIIFLVILLVFGAKRIPEMMKAMGQGVKEFKKATRDIASDEEDAPPAIGWRLLYPDP